MNRAYIIAYTRTPIGRYGGGLSKVRPDDLAAIPIQEIVQQSGIDPYLIDEVILGCANQAGEDNRNVARMSSLIAGLPVEIPALTVNRLCGSGMDAVICAMRAIQTGEADIVIAGGVESMSRAPFVMPKAESAFSRNAHIYDTTIGWRFVNKIIESQYGIESMPETAENVAKMYNISREEQDRFAFLSQEKTHAAKAILSEEITPVKIVSHKREDIISEDEHPRQTSLEKLSQLKAPFREGGSVTAGNASGVNDGAAAMLIISESMVEKLGLTPIAEIIGSQSAGIAPNIMGMGPVRAVQKLFERLNLKIEDVDIVELNEAFAAQAIPVLQELGLDPFADHINPHGGAIALGHPLGMSGTRIIGTAARTLKLKKAKYALATMCVGVGQGVAVILKSPE